MTTREIDASEVAQHASDGDAWLIIDNGVWDVSKFMDFHPGSKNVLMAVAGTDCTAQFYALHRENILEKYRDRLQIGVVKGAPPPPPPRDPGALSRVPHAEWESPFETEVHHRLRRAVREFVEKEIIPFLPEWEAKGKYPRELVTKMGEQGLLACALGPGKHLEMFADRLPGGIKPSEFDFFAEKVVAEEIKRTGNWAFCDGLSGGLVIGLPPVLNFGSKELVQRVVPEVLSGKKRICLAITDAYGGSDVANTTATATLSADGSHFVLTGTKKWITSGMDSDYFSVLCRTDGKGHAGLSMLLVERSEGVETEAIKTSYSPMAGTSYVTFEQVKVPVGNLLGKRGMGFALAMANFNHERWSMAVGGNRQSRLIVEEAFKWAYHRKVFGKRLIHQPQVQERLANMIGAVDSVSAYIDVVTAKMNKLSYKEMSAQLGGTMSLLKNQQCEAARIVNDNAIQIFGGRAFTKTGLGSAMENFQRTYQYGAVLGGASSVLATQAIRHALKSFPPDARL